MQLKISLIFKLKLLKLYYLFTINDRSIIKNWKKIYYNWVLIFYFNKFLLNINKFYLIPTSLNCNIKKLNFFKVNYINSHLFYNILNQNPYYKNILQKKNISNYQPLNLFFYYSMYLKNSNLTTSNFYSNFYQNNLYFIKFFVFKYLNLFLSGKNLYLSLLKDNLSIIEKSSLYKVLIKKTRRLGFLKEISFKTKSFINLILICLYNKDIILLKNTLKSLLEKLHFKKHRKLLYNLRVLLKSVIHIFFYKFKCLGLYIKVKGKIGVGGNLKKRKFLFKLGSFSFTKKSQKLVYVKDSIRTYSGVLGFESYLTYK